MGKGTRWLAEGLSASLCANLLAQPVLAARLGYFSLWGVVTGVLSMPFVMGVLLFGGVGAGLLQAGMGPSGAFFLGCARGMTRGLLAIAGGAAALPGGMIPVLLPWQLAFCFFASGAALGYLLLRPRLRLREAALLFWSVLLAAGLSLAYAAFYYRGGTVVSADGSTGMVVIVTPQGTVVLCSGEGEYLRRMLAAQLLRCKRRDPLILVCAWDLSLNGILRWEEALSPACVLVPQGEISLLQGQLPADYRPITREPAEVLPGVWVSHPLPQLACVETGGRKLLKSWAGYDIIKASALPVDADLFVDLTGRVRSLSPELSLGGLFTGDTNLVLKGG